MVTNCHAVSRFAKEVNSNGSTSRILPNMEVREALLISEGRQAVDSGKLAEAIAASGLSQHMWAELLVVGDATLSRWLSGQRTPRREHAHRIALVLRQMEAVAA